MHGEEDSQNLLAITPQALSTSIAYLNGDGHKYTPVGDILFVCYGIYGDCGIIPNPFSWNVSSRCGLVTPYGDICPVEHWTRYWPVPLRHYVSTWNDVDLLSIGFCVTNLRPTWQELIKTSNCDIIVNNKTSRDYVHGIWRSASTSTSIRGG